MFDWISKKWQNQQFKKIIRSKADIPASVKEIFITPCWFNENCALVISKNGNYYGLWVVVYEPAYRQIPSFLKAIKILEHKSLEEVKKQIKPIHNKLNSSNPILVLYSRLPLARARISKYPWETVNKFNLPAGLKNPEKYLKPLDIIGIDRNEYYHLAIYLGKKKVCHIWDPDLKEKSVARISNWENFLSDNPGQIVGYRSLIPFKKKDLIIEQLAKSVVNQHGKDKHSLLFSSCEHFVHQIIYGLKFSEQVRRYFRIFNYVLDKFSLNLEVKGVEKEKTWEIALKIETIEYFDLEKEIEKNDKIFAQMDLDENVRKKIREIKSLMTEK